MHTLYNNYISIIIAWMLPITNPHVHNNYYVNLHCATWFVDIVILLNAYATFITVLNVTVMFQANYMVKFFMES